MKHSLSNSLSKRWKYNKTKMKTCDCKLRCSTCEICVHMHMCSCRDSKLHVTVCKHTHIITILKTRPALVHPNITAVCEVDYNIILSGDVPNNELENVCKQVVKSSDCNMSKYGCSKNII